MTSQMGCTVIQKSVRITKKVYLYQFSFFKVIYFYNNFSNNKPP